MKKLICILFLVGLMSIFAVTPDPEPIADPIEPIEIFTEQLLENITIPIEIEDDTEMAKTLDMVDQNIILDTTNNGMRNILFDGTYYFVADVIGNKGYIFRYNNAWGNKTEVWSGSSTAIGSIIKNAIPSILYVDSTYYVLFETLHDTVVEERVWFVSSTTAGGGLGTWSKSELFVLSGVVGQVSQAQLISVGTTAYACILNAPKTIFYIIALLDSSFYTKISTGTYSGAYSDATNIWFLHFKTSDSSYNIYKWNPVDGFVIDSTPSFSNGADIDFDYSQFYILGNNKAILWKSAFYYFENSVWKSTTIVSGLYTIPHWYLDSDLLKIKYWSIISQFASIKNEKYFIFSAYSSNHNFVAAWDTYAIDDDGHIFKLIASSNETIVSGKIKTSPYKSPKCDIQTTTEPITNEYMELYDDTDVLIHQAWVKSNLNNGNEILDFEMRSPVEQDLAVRVEKTYTIQTIDEILKDVIDTYCSFLYYTTHITAGTTGTYTKEFKNITVADIFAWCDEVEGLFTSIRPSHEVYFDDGEDLTGSITIVEGTDCSTGTRKREDLKISILTGYGGWDSATGKRFVATYQGEANYSKVQDWYPWITNQTELQTHVDAVGASKNQVVTKYNVVVYNKGFLKYGTKILYTSTTFGVTDEVVYVLANNYDIMTGFSEVVLCDKLVTNTQKDAEGEEDQGKRIENVEQYVDNTNDRLDNITSATQECSGFKATDTDYTLTFDDGTRTFTISPTGTTFNVYINGNRYAKTEETVTITDTQGMWYIYYSSTGVLTASQSMFEFNGIAWVATVYWDATNNTGLLGYENHKNTMDWATHENLHETRGCQWVSGLAVSGLGAAAISISAGEIHDEDLHHTYLAITDDPILILYRNAALNWLWVDGAAGRLYYVYNAGTSRIRFDSAGTLTDVDNTKFVNYYLFATPFLLETGGGLVAIMGQVQYNTAALAAAANISELSLAGLPSLEFKPIWKITLQSGATVTVQASQDLRSNVSLIGTTIIGANTADAISIIDSGALYTATNVESALQEVKTTADAAVPASRNTTIAGVKTFSDGIISTTINATTSFQRDGVAAGVYISKQGENRDAYDWIGITATDNDNLILDLVNGDEESVTGFDGVGESKTNHLSDNLIPAEATSVYLKIYIKADIASTSNYVGFYASDLVNVYQAPLCIPPPVANYYASYQIITKCTGGKIKLFFNIGGGATITCNLSILGYFL